MSRMSKQQQAILRDVIAAARDGRYCYGDMGFGVHVYVDKADRSVVITCDVINGASTRLGASESASRLKMKQPHRAENVAKDLEKMLEGK